MSVLWHLLEMLQSCKGMESQLTLIMNIMIAIFCWQTQMVKLQDIVTSTKTDNY